MAGIVGYMGNMVKHNDPGLLGRMVKTIKYLETNIVDTYTVDDLSIARVHHGVSNTERQPIFNEDGSLIIFMDGEVYGYEDEKKSLLKNNHRFEHRNNDAEFCLHLYEEFGKDSFIKLNGSFVIVIYDKYKKSIVIASDRFSSNPLFVCFLKDNNVVFGTQLNSITQCKDVPRNLDSQAVKEFFSFQKILRNRTYYNDVKILEPASILTVGKENVTIQTYWEMNYNEEYNKKESYYVESVEDALKTAVKRRTSDNCRYGILLSGGLDSRAVLAASDCEMSAFTIANFDNREVSIARKISTEKNCKHIFMKRSPNHYADILDLAVKVGDGMYRFDHAHFIGFFDRIKEDCDVLLHGCALGALFQGAYLPRKNVSCFGKNLSFPIQDSILNGNIRDTILNKMQYSLMDKNPRELFNKDFSGRFNGDVFDSIDSLLSLAGNHANNPYNKYEYFFFYFLVKHFTFLNELCIRPFIEERRIVLDVDLFDCYLEIPPEYRFNGRILKKALNRLNSAIAKIPNANTGVSPMMPESLDWGIQFGKRIANYIHPVKLTESFDNQGSWPTRSELIRHNDKIKTRIWDIIHDEQSVDTNIFNRSRLVDVYNKHMHYKDDYTWFLYLIPTFGVWYKNYGPHAG